MQSHQQSDAAPGSIPVPTACRVLEAQASLQAPPPWTLRLPSASLSSSLEGLGEGGEAWAAASLKGAGAGVEVLAPTSGDPTQLCR